MTYGCGHVIVRYVLMVLARLRGVGRRRGRHPAADVYTATKTFPDTAGQLIVGLRDVYAACMQFGPNVRWQELAG